ncbi:protein-tyrosine phosphatase-like protein [Rhexocercosporidium sp. MPI-PUGE-AT-0058]|nr:protein-tyrosine phosphatase-like protein [Rhexocercosporidium sp. MPI-PUGE-AT-0058]
MAAKRPLSPPQSPDTSSAVNPTPQFLTASLDTINQKFGLIEAHSATLLLQPDSTLTHPLSHLRDRWPRIKPFSCNRVLLSCLPCPYINASPITLGRANETFIATQGPESSIYGAGLFWRMLWQEMCEVVIMLTPTFEEGEERCGVYYPEEVGETKDLGEWGSVECVSRVKDNGTELREMKVVKMTDEGSEERTVYHFHFLAWPDHNVPTTEDRLPLLSLIKASRFRIDSPRNKENGWLETAIPPRIVHCSAGVGRTGTFMALDYLLQEFNSGNWVELSEGADPIFDTVKRLRDQRMGLVYKPGQYAFLYEVLREKWEQKEAMRLAAELTRPTKRGKTKHLETNGSK